jgi:rhodanese-related sulfurtransferase
MDEDGKEIALFTGDTLFVGDVGRPDLRENVGNIKAKATELAKQLYRSTREKIMTLPEDVIIYPTHGPGSLCGRNISPELQSTIGKEIKENHALQEMTEDEFVDLVLQDLPWVPKYFEHDVALNKAGAESFEQSIRKATPVLHASNLEEGVLLIDIRPADQFKSGHHENAINIPNGNKFETWLGSIVGPTESFYLIGEDEKSLHEAMEKVAKIGYEGSVVGLLWGETGSVTEDEFEVSDFEAHPDHYTIVDVRHENEVVQGKIFEEAIHIPLPRLREFADKLPTDKPIAVHCAGGLRSSMGSSLISKELKGVKVLDMNVSIKKFNK